MARVAPENRLDITTLDAFMAQRGGQARYADLMAIQGGESARRHFYITLERARERGWISTFAVDAIANADGLHPYDIYGNEWWSPTYVERTEALAQIEMDEINARLACVEAEFNLEKELMLT